MSLRVLTILAISWTTIVSVQGCGETTNPSLAGSAPLVESFTNTPASELALDSPIYSARQMTWRSSTGTLLVPGFSIDERWVLYEITPNGHVQELVARDDVRGLFVLAERSDTGGLVLGLATPEGYLTLEELLPDGQLRSLADDLDVVMDSGAIEDRSTGDLIALCERPSRSFENRALDFDSGELSALCRIELDGTVGFIAEDLTSRPREILPGSSVDNFLVRHYDALSMNIARMDLQGNISEVETSLPSGYLWAGLLDAFSGAFLVVHGTSLEEFEGSQLLRDNRDGSMDVLYSGRMRGVPLLAQDSESGAIFFGFWEASSALRLFRLGP